MKTVKAVLDELATLGHVELRRAKKFVVPRLVTLELVRKQATKARKSFKAIKAWARPETLKACRVRLGCIR